MFPHVCKLTIIDTDGQRYLKPKRPENLSLDVKKKVGAAKKCLFGVPDMKDTQAMLQEQELMDRQRFEERFGFCIEDLENFEKENNGLNFQVKRKCLKAVRKIRKDKRKALTNFNNQSVLTDYFKTRKSITMEQKKEEN